MMKRLIPILFAAAAFLGLPACDDPHTEHMEDYQTMVYFRNGGEQSLTLFRTGDDGVYAVPVCKSGFDLQGTASVQVVPLDDARMTMYNYLHETDLTMIPEDLYVFLDGDETACLTPPLTLDFGSDDAYRVIKLRINTSGMNALMEAHPEKTSALGLQLVSEDRLSEDINLLMLLPEVDIPMLSISRPGVETYRYTSASAVSNSYSNAVSLNMNDNRWDFDCTLAVKDAAWLDAYNAEHGTSFALMPKEAYDLSAGKLSFSQGETSVPFTVTVNREPLVMLQDYVLPICAVSCSKPEFAVSDEPYLLHVTLDPDRITLTGDMVSVSHNQDNDGTGAPALVDGNASTYWHSPWSSYVTNPDPVYGIYVDIDLASPLKAFVLNYMVRSTNNNGRPTHVVIGVSRDGSTWTQVGEAQTEEMASSVAGQVITLPVCKSSETFTHIRFGIAESASGDLRVPSSGAYTALSEIELYGTAN